MPDPSADAVAGHIHVALPVTDETDWLPLTLEDIYARKEIPFSLYICVNQPDDWWEDAAKRPICLRNQATLKWLQHRCNPQETIVDRCSPGNGWKNEKQGVGWARKTLMDTICGIANPEDLIISIDADTRLSDTYFRHVASAFANYPDALGAVSAYYHPIPGNPSAARAILRYEIYMRYYLLNLWRIHSPYAYTALGSAMACRVSAYRKVGGLTPKASGEDFYFLQKLRKAGPLVALTADPVYPAARFSSRVGFGTGPAMIRGAAGDWLSYPIYASHLFDEIEEAYRLFPSLLNHTPEHRVFSFLASGNKPGDPFGPLRKNFREPSLFVRACHEKLDGLRILQYLKIQQKTTPGRDEDHLLVWLDRFYPEKSHQLIPLPHSFSFTETSVEQLQEIRDFLFEEEMRCRTSSGPLLPDWQLPAT